MAMACQLSTGWSSAQLCYDSWRAIAWRVVMARIFRKAAIVRDSWGILWDLMRI
jgi:hypothetical protein